MNLDLQDFFPTFNFGRVRGFFIRDSGFLLNDKVATIIAQIACYDNGLPQGSPCSPIIADLIAHILDIRLVKIAKRNRLTYSRYADDLTFSTNQATFPPSIAQPITRSTEWKLGEDLTKAIQTAGFSINPAKTRMQFRMSRQLVTGLTVNTKVNIRSDYYRHARAMCHRLFETGVYHRPSGLGDTDGQPLKSLGPIEGVLSHIHHVKNSIDNRPEKEKKDSPTASRRLHARFLKYKYFVRLERPLIVCEGKTDSIYLKCAIRKLTSFHPKLGSWNNKTFTSAVTFFNYDNQACRILNLEGGTGDLTYFFTSARRATGKTPGYRRDIQSYKHTPLKYPVIVLIDNDEGAKAIFNILKDNYKDAPSLMSISWNSSALFYHVTDNLYLIKTPEKNSDGMSRIEDFFEPSLLEARLNGKKFNSRDKKLSNDEYGKFLFATKVVQPSASKINFSAFSQVLDRIVAVIDDYVAPPI